MKPRIIYLTTAGREELPMTDAQLGAALSLENENAAMRAINQLVTEMLVGASVEAAANVASPGTHEGGRLDALFEFRTTLENLRRFGTRQPAKARARGAGRKGGGDE